MSISAEQPGSAFLDALVELLTLPAYRRLLASNRDLAAAFLARLEALSQSW